MALSASDQHHWDQEQPVLERARKEHPEWFISSPKEPGMLMRRVGVLTSSKDRPKGYIKYSPLDFIVEEIRPNTTVIPVDGTPVAPEYEDGQGTVYVDLTKVGISTLDAVSRIADGLQMQRKYIGYAGIKDAVALTAQRLSLRGVSLLQVQSLRVPNCLLRNVIERKGAIGVGNLYGNRFTLFIRTNGRVDHDLFQARIDRMAQNGIMNYYGVQRFGSPRFLSHLFGLHLLKGDYKECVKAVLTKESEFDLPFYTRRRERAKSLFGNWRQMREAFADLPYTYRFELQILDALHVRPDHFLGALHAVGDQASMWARAYASYLANLLMSEAEKEGQPLPSELPLLLSPDVQVEKLYHSWLTAHGTSGFRAVLPELTFLQVGKNPTVETMLKPAFHGFKILEDGVVVSFDLQKGAYATTVLEAMFDLVSGHPVPAWLRPRDVDTKKELGARDLNEVRALLAQAIGNVMGMRGEDE